MPDIARHADPRAERVIAFFQALTPAELQRLDEIYLSDVRFKDPFNEVQGIPAVRQIFEHMFNSLDNPRFIVRTALVDGAQCFLTWDFVFGLRGGGRRTLTVHGSSHLCFGTDGRIQMHRDYWDVAEELYEKLPLVGALMRWLKRRAMR